MNIGINVPVYPDLVPVPGYPVYYDPRASSNYFFYENMYWVYRGDNWYSSSWYDGPWQGMGPEEVPLFVLRVPVRYYRQPPSYFRGWRTNEPPHWGEHWGHDWEARRSGWDRWDRRSAPRAAPLPIYQRRYSGDRYPRTADQQQAIRAENDRPQPRGAVTHQHAEQQGHPGHSRAEPQQQAPVRQHSSTQLEHVRPHQQAIQPKPMHPNVARSAQDARPSQPMRQTQPQQHPQGQRQQTGKDNGQAAPQEKGRQESKNEERGPDHP